MKTCARCGGRTLLFGGAIASGLLTTKGNVFLCSPRCWHELLEDELVAWDNAVNPNKIAECYDPLYIEFINKYLESSKLKVKLSWKEQLRAFFCGYVLVPFDSFNRK